MRPAIQDRAAVCAKKMPVEPGKSKEKGQTMVYLGIDPGRKGAIATIWDDEHIVIIPMSDENMIHRARLLHGENVRCCLEQVHAMPKQGVTSMFTFGMGYGFIKGCLESFGISYQEIPPQRWKKEFGLTGAKADSIAVCKRLFPGVKLRMSDLCKTDSDGMAEALLMAEYARRKL